MGADKIVFLNGRKYQNVGDAASDSALSVIIQFLISKLIGLVPFLSFLNWPIIGPLITGWITGLLENLFAQLKLLFDINIVALVVDAQREAYEKAVADLGKIIDNTAATPEQIAAAQQAFKDQIRNLIHSDIKRRLGAKRAFLLQ